MRKELNMDEITHVTGGNAYINGNTMKIAFDTIDEVFKLKDCTLDEARSLCASFIGKCSTVEEYDATCLKALRDKNWV